MAVRSWRRRPTVKEKVERDSIRPLLVSYLVDALKQCPEAVVYWWPSEHPRRKYRPLGNYYITIGCEDWTDVVAFYAGWNRRCDHIQLLPSPDYAARQVADVLSELAGEPITVSAERLYCAQPPRGDELSAE